ncbi:MAG: hypothetical protein ACOCUR_02650 [Nanoarchaeota archaeon]
MTLSEDSRRIMLAVFFFSLSFLLSSCEELLVRNTPEEKEILPARFDSCGGSSSATLRDACIANSSMKLLIANTQLNDIVRVDFVITGNLGEQSASEKVSIDMEETPVIEVKFAENIGTPEKFSVAPFFLTGRGVESCDSLEFDLDDLRPCTS